LVVAVALVVVWESSSPAVKVFQGSAGAITALLQSSEEPIGLLVCSDSNGEGAVVAAAALLAPDRIAVQRGSKLLSTSDWLGRGYVANFANEGEMLDLLGASGITHVIVDEGVPESAVWPHQLAVSKAIRSRSDRFSAVVEVPARRRDIRGRLTIATFSN
jgi:hypothetical protein